MEHIKKYVISQFERFLREDDVEWDLTSMYFAHEKSHFDVLLKDESYVPDLFIFRWILEHYGIEVLDTKQGGFFKDTILFRLKGDASDLLAIERSFLNLLSHFLGVSTLTKKAVMIRDEISPRTRIAGTRKTYPGLRYFEKMAILLSGGDTHRFSLKDMVMIKDNHIVLCGGDIKKLIREIRQKVGFSKKIEVEVDSIARLKEVIDEDVDIIMLDNFTPSKIKTAMDIIRAKNDRVLVEASGGITLDNLRDYLETGVDIISMGSLIYSAPWINISMEASQ